MVLVIYVDDIVLIGNDPEACKEFKIYLHTSFSIKDIGPLKYFFWVLKLPMDHKVYFLASENIHWKLLMNVVFWEQNLSIFLWRRIINLHWHQDACWQILADIGDSLEG